MVKSQLYAVGRSNINAGSEVTGVGFKKKEKSR